MKKYIVIAILILLLILGGSLFLNLTTTIQPSQNNTHPESDDNYEVPNRPAFERSQIPDNIYKAICMLGHPMFVTKWELDPNTRFLFFKGPFKESKAADSRVYPYMYRTLSSLDAENVGSTLLIDSLDDYQDKIQVNEREQFLLPLLQGVPDRFDKLTKLLGQWDAKHNKKNPDRSRIVYNKKLCIGNNLAIGAYFDIVDNRIIKAKGITNLNKLLRIMANRKKINLTPDIKPLRYIDHIPGKGSAKYTVTQLILLREAGEQEKAKELVSNQLQSSIKNDITQKADTNSAIRMESFTYQATKYTSNSAYIAVRYYLQNGSLIKTQHKVILENKIWRIRY